MRGASARTRKPPGSISGFLTSSGNSGIDRLGDILLGDILGYARGSTGDQDEAAQTMRTEDEGAIRVVTDAMSGNRKGLQQSRSSPTTRIIHRALNRCYSTSVKCPRPGVNSRNRR